MSLQEIGLLFTRRPSAFTAVLVLLALLFCRGYSQGGSRQHVVALLGDDADLPCFLETPVDASGMQLEWARTDLTPGFIHVWGKNREDVELKQPSYVGRTSLSSDKLKHGDVSLTLSKVQLSDEGPYRCFVPQLGQKSYVDLVVGSVSAPAIKMTSNHSSRVVLQCESAGWYPEPELLWLDGEGNLLPAEPTETLRGPDGLYTVSSRVTVEKNHSNNITCRVQQKNIDQSRETHIRVPGPVIRKKRSATFIVVVVCLLYVCVVVALVWNCAAKICPKKPDPEKEEEEEELKRKKHKQTRAPADDTETKERKEEQLENHPSDPDTGEETKEDEKEQETDTRGAAQAALTSSES